MHQVWISKNVLLYMHQVWISKNVLLHLYVLSTTEK